MKLREQDYSDEERQNILEHIYGEVSSGRSLHSILLEDDDMPGSSTFWRWHMADEAVRDNLAHARLNGVEALMEKAVHVAENPQMGFSVTSKPITNKEGDVIAEVEETKREDMLGHRRLMVDTYLKRAQMIAPRKYGPKLDLTSGNEPLLNDPVDVAARAASLLALAKERKEGKNA